MSGFVPTLNVDEKPLVQNSKPNIKKPIPPVPKGLDLTGKITLVLFYQYVEPAWTKKQHKHAVKRITEIAKKFGVNGRGRCAPEGLNCTLTATAHGMRAFCQGLRDFDPIFENTDFKFTDDMPYEQRFKALSIKKVGELVAYGLEGEIAPSLQNGGQHLEAPDYHKMLVDKKGPPTVVIDVRNAYESAIGHFQPPPGGAELLDPKMRNSNGFPYWLNLPETREKLNGKRVMMYCTGGIRCERATALLNEITATDPNFKTQGVYELRGGIERYMKTFPKGGVWKGKNYVFDRRRAQVPAEKPVEDLNKEIESKCANPDCRAPWDDYRGRLKCCGEVAEGTCTAGSTRCGVPVMLCDKCFDDPNVDNSKQRCDLCLEGYVPPIARVKIDLQGQRRQVLGMGGKVVHLSHLKRSKPDAASSKGDGSAAGADIASAKKKSRKEKGSKDNHSTADSSIDGRRLFVGKLPFIVTAAEVRQALNTAAGASSNAVSVVDWKRDNKSGLFNGAAFVLMTSAEAAQRVVAVAKNGPGIVVGPQAPTRGKKKGKGKNKNKNKKIKVTLAPVRDGETWPKAGFVEQDSPPIV